MLQIRGVKGEAVVTYRKPLTTKEMQYPRLSRRVKNKTNLTPMLDFTSNGFQHLPKDLLKALLLLSLTIPCHIFYATMGFTDGIKDSEMLTKDLGKKFWGDRTFKPYPSCRAIHGLIDCALKIG